MASDPGNHIAAAGTITTSCSRSAVTTGGPSVLEASHLQSLGVLDNLTVLKMWIGATAKAIFPNRRIGYLHEGYGAGFLALEGSALGNRHNVRRIRVRLRQGVRMHPWDSLER